MKAEVFMLLNELLALSGKTYANIALSDSPPEKAMEFVVKQLGKQVEQDPQLVDIVSALGGRFTELEAFVQKMKMNMDAQCIELYLFFLFADCLL